MSEMSENNQSMILSPAKAITKRPSRALLPLTARQIVPAIGAAALVWGASRIVAQAMKHRRQQQRLQTAENTLSRPVVVYRHRSMRITISSRE